MRETDPALAANRFGLGARPSELTKIAGDPRGWLLQQVTDSAETSPDIDQLPGSRSIIVEVDEARKAQRAAARDGRDEAPVNDVARKFGAVARRHYLAQAQARFRHATTTDWSFRERLVHFWSNHFAVSADKQPLSALAGAFENEAIRPALTGSFYDLLLSVEQHPAMIMYLDNQRSIGPNSELARRAGRFRRQKQLGLNENLAREILELHTLGVGAGYTQADVTSFAKVITGWTLGGGSKRHPAQGTPGTFEFRAIMHEPGDHVVLGKSYRERGLDQGEAVLRDLASHPATAHFIATKLCRHFVADEPPAAMVDRVAARFLATDGDLPSVHTTLIESDEAWEQPFVKLKTPAEFLISAFRALDRVPENGRFVVGALEAMGQPVFRPGSPAGWPDVADHWGGADGLFKRIEWAAAFARRLNANTSPLETAAAALGPGLGDHSRTAISRADSREQGLVLFLVSPEFQRR